MYTNIKRITSLLLALVMSFSLLTTAFAADGGDPDDIPEGAIVVTDQYTGAIVGYYGDDGYVDLTDSQPVTDADQPAEPIESTFTPEDDLALVTKFSDVKSTAWYYNDVTECAKLGIVAGFADGTFKPEDKVTSVQFITMLTRTFYADELDVAQKSKPAGSAWYWANAKVATDVGMSKNLKAVDDNAMNRYEMAVALRNTATSHNKSITSDQSNAAINAIKDYKSIPSSYRTPVKTCYALGIITGMSDGTFAGTQSMTRAQACTVIMRMLKLIKNYNPGDKDNNQYDDGKEQNPSTGNQNQTTQSGKLANGQDATVANVQAILNQIKREYPEGTSWGTSSTPGTNYYKDAPSSTAKNRDLGVMNATVNPPLSLQYACGGFMAMVSERIFGKTGAPCREVTNANQVRPGDILMVFDSNGKLHHYAICLSVTQSKTTGSYEVTIADAGGNNGYVCWQNSKFIAKSDGAFTQSYRVYTRYPN